MNFSQAFKEVLSGQGMRLQQWESTLVVRAQYPKENSEMTEPYLSIESSSGKIPWQPNMDDLFEENWEIVSWMSCIREKK